MKIRVGSFPYTECWDGVLYKNVPGYPEISPWEIQGILDCIRYEEEHGRACPVEADEGILRAIEACRPVWDQGIRIPPPALITECTACPRYHGCLTEYVCHTASVENAVSILAGGRLLSAVRARKRPASVLKAEARNAANDPEDYFEYVMFSWGNCQAGDRLVMERRLGRFPDETDLTEGFRPGVRFYFRYEDLARSPRAVYDGVHPLKIRDEVVLKDCLFAAVVPETERAAVAPFVPAGLRSRISYLPYNGEGLWGWSEKVFEHVRSLRQEQP